MLEHPCATTYRTKASLTKMICRTYELTIEEKIRNIKGTFFVFIQFSCCLCDTKGAIHVLSLLPSYSALNSENESSTAICGLIDCGAFRDFQIKVQSRSGCAALADPGCSPATSSLSHSYSKAPVLECFSTEPGLSGIPSGGYEALAGCQSGTKAQSGLNLALLVSLIILRGLEV